MASGLKGHRKELITLLKSHYRNRYSSINPLPWKKDKRYSIDQIFINGGIEILIIDDNPNLKIRWESLETYQGIYRDPRIKKSKRRILEGHPGYGKSLLTLKLAYDWCNGVKDSPVNNVDILILLKFKHLSKVKSISEGIKQFLLPVNSTLTSEQIEKVIKSTSSVSILFDGYDKCLFMDTFIGSDVTEIVNNKIIDKFDVTLSSGYLPDEPILPIQRIRLTGFNQESRDHYMQKVNLSEIAGKVRRILAENPVLSDLCRVPSMFAMFAHASQEEVNVTNYRTVTGLVRGLVSCFFSQLRRTLEAEEIPGFSEQEIRKLGEVAIEGVRNNKPMLWEKATFKKRIGDELFNCCIRVGILIEEDESTVTFYHPVFCEWFAAYHVSELASRDDVKLYPPFEMDALDETEKNIESKTLEDVDPDNVLFLYHFAAGMNAVAAKNLHHYLNRITGCDRLAVLCLLEHEEQSQEGSLALRNVCEKEIDVCWYDKEARQRSTIDMLECAALNNVPIASIVFHESLRCINDSRDKVIFTSGLSMNYLSTLQEIWIEQREREFTADEFHSILQYAAKCDQLKIIKFCSSLVPQYVNAGEAQFILLRRKCEVFFNILGIWYFLDLARGTWQFRTGRDDLPEGYYERIAEEYREFFLMN